MTIAVTSLLNLATTGFALAIVAPNIAVATKKRVTTKDILGLGITNIVGVSLLGAQAKIIGTI